MLKVISLVLVMSLTSCATVGIVGVKPIVKPNTPNVVTSVVPKKDDVKKEVNSVVLPSSQPLGQKVEQTEVKVIPAPTNVPIPQPSNSIVPSDSNLTGSVPTSTPATTLKPLAEGAEPNNSTFTPTPAMTSFSKDMIPSYYPGKKLEDPYKANTTPFGVTSGRIELIFRDEYRIRYDFNKRIFISLVGKDISSINNLIAEYKITNIIGYLGSKTEEKALEIELRLEKEYGYDERNDGSSYDLYVKDINILEFINKMRANEFVRMCNYNNGDTRVI